MIKDYNKEFDQERKTIMTLSDANIKEQYIVEELSLKQPIKRRLEAMGLIEGTMIRKNNEATDGSIIFTVRGTRLAVGKDVADYIVVRDVLPGEEQRPRRRFNGQGRGIGHNKRRRSSSHKGHGKSRHYTGKRGGK